MDPAGRTFKLKAARGKEAEITVDDSTVIKRGKEPATFDEAVAVGATLNVEVLNNLALAITAKK